MSGISTIGMSAARRRIFEAGMTEAEKRHNAEMMRRREAARAANEARVAAEKDRRQAAAEAETAKNAERAIVAARAGARAMSRHPVSIIIAEVAAAHSLTPDDITGPCKAAHLSLARHEAMWRARGETGLSLPALGQRFGGRHYTAVLHGVRKHERRLSIAQTPEA